MNFLGHLYFSNNDLELMYSNLFGDYVKGKDYTHYPKKLQNGITLHREIDHYIDSHPRVLELLRTLYPKLPKISGIAVDLYFDHILARRWNEFHSTDLRTFVNEFYNYNPKHENHYSTEFKFLIEKMKEYDWIYRYKEFEGLDSACKGLSKRISFENSLASAPTVFLQLESEIESTFDAFLKEAKLTFKH